MKNFHRFSIAVAILASGTKAQFFPTVDDAYNPQEERGSFDFVMKPYEIPPETTTYVDFFFNIPDDLPDTFHITYGEVINSQPDHLHHFVLQGCPEKIDPSREGIPVNFDEDDFPSCTIPLGQWAPGADIFGNTDLETGILLGRGMGIQAVSLNVHYTDGVYADEAETQLKLAEDGIRVHYTPNFRPYTSVSKPMIYLAMAPEILQVPAGEDRFFVSKTCEVTSGCVDADVSTVEFVAYMILGFNPEDLAQFGLSQADCPSLAPLAPLLASFAGEFLGDLITRMCPKSAGLCEAPDDGVNPFDPGSYRVTSVNYHAHLLGREMYTTLLRGEETTTNDTTTAVQKQVELTTEESSSNIVATDLESRPFWIYDFQETIPLDVETRGTEIRPGDKIQVSCIYDSNYRDFPTNFGLSTYDEMCITTLQVTFETPQELLDGSSSEAAAVSLATQFELMSFSCAGGPKNDIYSGVLLADEDGRDIWKDHPIETAQGCTFPELSFWQGALMAPNNCEYEYSDDFFSDDDESPSLENDSSMDKDEDIMCAADVQECSDGSFVSRDPTNDCAFPACPSADPNTDTTEVENGVSSANGGAFGKLASLVSIAAAVVVAAII